MNEIISRRDLRSVQFKDGRKVKIMPRLVNEREYDAVCDSLRNRGITHAGFTKHKELGEIISGFGTEASLREWDNPDGATRIVRAYSHRAQRMPILERHSLGGDDDPATLISVDQARVVAKVLEGSLLNEQDWRSISIQEDAMIQVSLTRYVGTYPTQFWEWIHPEAPEFNRNYFCGMNSVVRQDGDPRQRYQLIWPHDYRLPFVGFRLLFAA